MSQIDWNSIDWVPTAQKIGMAIAILIITWIVARIVVWLFTRLSSRIGFLQRAGADGDAIGSSIGKVASLIVWLFGLIAVLQVFNLTSVLTPIQNLLNTMFGYLPNIIGAIFVFIIGSVLAKIARQLTETALGTIPFSKWMGKKGDEAAAQETSIPRVVGVLVYALILIVVAIAALQVLNIESISAPATAMLQSIFNAIPNILAAGLMLALGVFIARFLGGVLGELLDGMSIDKSLHGMGVIDKSRSATPTIVRIVEIGIVLFFSVIAAQLLNFPAITTFLTEVLALGGRVIFGGLVIAAGVFLANLLSKMFSGGAAMAIRYATIVLFSAMGLTFMGIAPEIVTLAFGALVVGAGAAGALAFGLGGREAAAKYLAERQKGTAKK